MSESETSPFLNSSEFQHRSDSNSSCKPNIHLFILFLLLFLVIYVVAFMPTSNTIILRPSDDISISNCSDNKINDDIRSQPVSSFRSLIDPQPFLNSSLKAITDKVTDHSYQYLYAKYLFLIERPRFLEIGLGCGMPYGPGHSLPLWKEVLPPHSDIHIGEFDKGCTLKWMNGPGKDFSRDNMHFIDQSKFIDLSRMLEEADTASRPFHAIVDDGGHTMSQQLVSFLTLFPTIAPGGFYVLEDLLTSNIPAYFDMGQTRTIHMIHCFLQNFVMQRERVLYDIEKYMLSFDCSREICVFVRNETPQSGPKEVSLPSIREMFNRASCTPQ